MAVPSPESRVLGVSLSDSIRTFCPNQYHGHRLIINEHLVPKAKNDTEQQQKTKDFFDGDEGQDRSIVQAKVKPFQMKRIRQEHKPNRGGNTAGRSGRGASAAAPSSSYSLFNSPVPSNRPSAGAAAAASSNTFLQRYNTNTNQGNGPGQREGYEYQHRRRKRRKGNILDCFQNISLDAGSVVPSDHEGFFFKNIGIKNNNNNGGYIYDDDDDRNDDDDDDDEEPFLSDVEKAQRAVMYELVFGKPAKQRFERDKSRNNQHFSTAATTTTATTHGTLSPMSVFPQISIPSKFIQPAEPVAIPIFGSRTVATSATAVPLLRPTGSSTTEAKTSSTTTFQSVDERIEALIRQSYQNVMQGQDPYQVVVSPIANDDQNDGRNNNHHHDSSMALD